MFAPNENYYKLYAYNSEMVALNIVLGTYITLYFIYNKLPIMYQWTVSGRDTITMTGLRSWRSRYMGHFEYTLHQGWRKIKHCGWCGGDGGGVSG